MSQVKTGLRAFLRESSQVDGQRYLFRSPAESTTISQVDERIYLVYSLAGRVTTQSDDIVISITRHTLFILIFMMTFGLFAIICRSVYTWVSHIFMAFVVSFPR